MSRILPCKIQKKSPGCATKCVPSYLGMIKSVPNKWLGMIECSGKEKKKQVKYGLCI